MLKHWDTHDWDTDKDTLENSYFSERNGSNDLDCYK